MGCCHCKSPLNGGVNVVKPQPQEDRDESNNNVPGTIVEGAIVIWLDPSMNPNTNTDVIRNQLQRAANCVFIYKDPNECLTFIHGLKYEKVHLIVSRAVNEEFITNARDNIPQIEIIYPYSFYDEIMAATGSQSEFVLPVNLCEELMIKIRNSNRNLLGIQIINPALLNSSAGNDQQDAMFMYDQLVRHIILSRIDDNLTETNVNVIMADVFKFCDNYPTKRENDINFKTEFKTQYQSKHASYWYSCDVFFYGTLNHALRTHNYQTIYELGAFIRQLHKHLNEYALPITGTLALYRGQRFSKEDFEKIQSSKGRLLSFTCFLSTSREKTRAIGFAEENLAYIRDVSTLLEITVSIENSTVPFADITEWSAFPREKECLFSIGTVFRIDSIENLEEDPRIRKIKLSLTNDYDKQLASLTDHFKYLLIDNDVLVNLAKLAQQLSQWDHATYFWKLVIATRDEKQHSAAYNNLGSIEFEKGNLEQALKYYEKSLELEKRFTNENDSSLIPTYNNIGTVYYKQGDLDRALESFQKAIEIHDISSNKNQEITATIFVNMTSILNQQGKHKEALEIIEKCLNIQINIYPDLHPNLATTYNTIAVTCNYWRLFAVAYGNREKEIEFTQRALQYAKKALEIDERALPPNHPQRILHQKNFDYYTKLAGFIF